jgi:membrane protease YdiL (CAAX protease family)
MATGSGRGAASISDRSHHLTGPHDFARSEALARPLAFVAVLFVAWVLRLAALPVSDLAAADVADARTIAELWRFAIWILLPLGWVFWIERIDPRLAIDQRPGQLAWLAWLVAVVATLGARGVDVLAGSDWIAIPPVAPASLIVASVSLAFAALCEEFVFRGLVLKGLRKRMAFWPANAAAALLYAAILAPGWLALVELDAGAFGYLFASVFAFALLLGWLVRLTGTIWVAVAARFFNDFLQGFGFSG